MPTFRCYATIVWNVEAEDSDILDNSIKETLKGIPQHLNPKIDRIVKKPDKRMVIPNTITLGSFPVDEVMPFVGKNAREYKVGDQTFLMKMNSHRYYVFMDSLSCAACGLTGSKFLLEHNLSNKSPHFNLYGEEDGQLVLMTKDHIHPKSKGGKNNLPNYATTCSICNNLKGNSILDYKSVYELRKIYNEGRKQFLTQKKLSFLLKEKTNELLKNMIK